MIGNFSTPPRYYLATLVRQAERVECYNSFMTQPARKPMKLFDDIEWHDQDPAGYAESKFAYLNRTGRPEAGRVRQIVEEWFSRYPLHHRAELRSRFRSPNNHNHLAAFFELSLHELLVRLGHVVEIHPQSSGVIAKRPDFLVTSGGGDRFYIEAVLATDETVQEAAAQARLATLPTSSIE